MTVVDNIEENIEKGKKAIEDFAKELTSKDVKKAVVNNVKKGKNILKKIEEKIHVCFSWTRK